MNIAIEPNNLKMSSQHYLVMYFWYLYHSYKHNKFDDIYTVLLIAKNEVCTKNIHIKYTKNTVHNLSNGLMAKLFVLGHSIKIA